MSRMMILVAFRLTVASSAWGDCRRSSCEFDCAAQCPAVLGVRDSFCYNACLSREQACRAAFPAVESACRASPHFQGVLAAVSTGRAVGLWLTEDECRAGSDDIATRLGQIGGGLVEEVARRGCACVVCTDALQAPVARLLQISLNLRRDGQWVHQIHDRVRVESGNPIRFTADDQCEIEVVVESSGYYYTRSRSIHSGMNWRESNHLRAGQSDLPPPQQISGCFARAENQR